MFTITMNTHADVFSDRFHDQDTGVLANHTNTLIIAVIIHENNEQQIGAINVTRIEFHSATQKEQ